MNDDTTVTKRCAKCGETQPSHAFARVAKRKNGLDPWCKRCKAQAAAAWRAAHPEQQKAAQARCYATKRETYLAKNRARYEANRERYDSQRAVYRADKRDEEARRARAWYVANHERALIYRRRYSLLNPEKRAEAHARRRAAKRNAPINDFTAIQWRGVLEYFDYRCAYCGQPSDTLTQEHMQPLSRGGSHTQDNIVPACGPCNRSKSARTLLESLLMKRP